MNTKPPLPIAVCTRSEAGRPGLPSSSCVIVGTASQAGGPVDRDPHGGADSFCEAYSYNGAPAEEDEDAFGHACHGLDDSQQSAVCGFEEVKKACDPVNDIVSRGGGPGSSNLGLPE